MNNSVVCSLSNMHSVLGLDLLIERRLFHVSLFMFKINKKLLQSSMLVCLFEELGERHDRQTRSVDRGDLIVPKSRTRYGDRAIVVFGSRIWNLVPEELRALNTVETFAKHYWSNNQG